MENHEKGVPSSEDHETKKTPSVEEQGYIFDKMMAVEETDYDNPEKSPSIHKEDFEEEPKKKPSLIRRYLKFIQ